jgi:hypothetical protein
MEIRRNSKIEGILSIAMMGNFSLVVDGGGMYWHKRTWN